MMHTSNARMGGDRWTRSFGGLLPVVAVAPGAIPAVCGPAKYGHDTVIDAAAKALGAGVIALNLARYTRAVAGVPLLVRDLARFLDVDASFASKLTRVLDAAALGERPRNQLAVCWGIDELEPRESDTFRSFLNELDAHSIAKRPSGWLRPLWVATVPKATFESIVGSYRLGKVQATELAALTAAQLAEIGAAVGWDAEVVRVVDKETAGHPFLVHLLVGAYDPALREEIVRRGRWPLADSDRGPLGAFFAEVREARALLPAVEHALADIADERTVDRARESAPIQHFLARWIFTPVGRVPGALRRWLAR